MAIAYAHHMSFKPPILIVGAGFTGAVLARELVEKGGFSCVVIDSRDHVAGNCHTARGNTGVLEHVYGPHIFNTNFTDVVSYLSRWSDWVPHVNRVKAVNRHGVFSLPINLHTINQFFGKTFTPTEARAFVATLGDPTIDEPANFEEQALKFVGRELYEAFLRGYTLKQWGTDPRELPASILRRLPVRFDYNDNYYKTSYQAMPRDGYTPIVERLLQHPDITVKLEIPFESAMASEFAHVFYSGPIDAYFDHRFGRLGYRTIFFEKYEGEGNLLGNAVINYTDEVHPFTRQHEHKHFSPWETHERSVVFREFSKATAPGDVPFYPMRLASDKVLYDQYAALAKELGNVTFVGRLGTYRYLDMDQVIGEALDTSTAWLAASRAGATLPIFSLPREK
jgi:UDP-galactopyranose mutase